MYLDIAAGKDAVPSSPAKGGLPDSRSSLVTPLSAPSPAPAPTGKSLLLGQVKALPVAKPWTSKAQFTQYLESTLVAAKAAFDDVGLTYLAEKCTLHLIELLRARGDVERIAAEYRHLSQSFGSLAESGNASSSFSLGTYYWVIFVGRGVPESYRHEFIYRNSNNLHISEFHALVKTFLETAVEPRVKVVMSNKSAPTPADSDSEDAIIFITSVTPVLSEPSVACPHSLNQASVFRHSLPFTLGSKAHAANMADQYKRTFTLTVAIPFPFCCNRQIVHSKFIKELTPIEVAIDDIEERIVSFRDELKSNVLNNIQRLVQGSIMPQVNLGTGEVAKVFLTDCKGGAVGSPLQTKLQVMSPGLYYSLFY